MAITVGTTRQVSVRFPKHLIDEVDRRHGGTTTDYVVQAVQEKLLREREAEIAAGLACLAGDDEANDISDFAPAQRRAMARVD